MEEFSASLIREKIVFTDNEIGDDGVEKDPVVIRSNRIYLRLSEPPNIEKVVVRAQNMHMTLRLAAKILTAYYEDGLFQNHLIPFDWEQHWKGVLSSYERHYNPQAWASIYINGKSVFKTTTSPFVDIIEKCALLTIDNYDATMDVTENALKQVGHAMRIDHSSNVAAVLTDSGDNIRCGVIHRADGKNRTFNFTATRGEQERRVVQSMGATAAYLEAFNLLFTVRKLQNKLRGVDAKKNPEEAEQMQATMSRLSTISKAILSFERIYSVKYRPAKPDLFSFM